MESQTLTPTIKTVLDELKRLPGLGYRSAERIALHLLVEKPERLPSLVKILTEAANKLRRCPITGSITESDFCPIYANPNRERQVVCLIESVSDLYAFERAGVFQGTYHILHGKLSPLHGLGPEELNLKSLSARIKNDEVQEIILALSNDVEGEATCHYIQDVLLAEYKNLKISRIGFGLPSGSGITYADPSTLRSALDGRR